MDIDVTVAESAARTDRQVLESIEARLESIEESIKQMQQIVETVGAQVMPTVNALMENKLIKMALGVK